MTAVFSGYERAVSDCHWTVIERFRIRFMASGKRQFVPSVQAFPLLIVDYEAPLGVNDGHQMTIHRHYY